MNSLIIAYENLEVPVERALGWIWCRCSEAEKVLGITEVGNGKGTTVRFKNVVQDGTNSVKLGDSLPLPLFSRKPYMYERVHVNTQ